MSYTKRLVRVNAEIEFLIPKILENSLNDEKGYFIMYEDLRKIIEENIGVYDTRSIGNHIRLLVAFDILVGGEFDKQNHRYSHYNIIMGERIRKVLKEIGMV